MLRSHCTKWPIGMPPVILGMSKFVSQRKCTAFPRQYVVLLRETATKLATDQRKLQDDQRKEELARQTVRCIFVLNNPVCVLTLPVGFVASCYPDQMHFVLPRYSPALSTLGSPAIFHSCLSQLISPMVLSMLPLGFRLPIACAPGSQEVGVGAVSE